MEHDGCKGCRYEKENADSVYCQGCKQNAVDKYAKKTNADRIREMTNEELAEQFVCSYMSIVDGEAYPIYEAVHEGCQYEAREDAEKAELEWLESECDTE